MDSPRSPLVLCFLALTVASCGKSGSSAPSSPTAASPVTSATSSAPTTTTTTIAATVGPYTFNFSDTTTAADQALIRDSVNFAHEFLQTLFGRTVQNPATITTSTTAPGCGQGGAAAFTGQGVVTICIGNPGWMQPGTLSRQKIVIHEVYHVLQFERHWLGQSQNFSGPDWIVEGAAELFGFRGMSQRGWVSTETARGCWVKEVADFGVRNPPGLPNLNALETHQQFQGTIGPLYPLSAIGVDRLLAGPGVSALNSYMDLTGSGTMWQAAFQSAFGLTPAAFYDQFPAYRAGLTVPPAYLCGG